MTQREILKPIIASREPQSRLSGNADFGGSHPSGHRDERGIALILVTFVVALSVILVVNLAHTTFLNSRSLGLIQRQLQSEYALKSLINAAVALVQRDSTPGIDAGKDPWGAFLDGRELPAELMGIQDPGVRAFLEIRPTNSRLRLSSLEPVGKDASPLTRDRFERMRDIFARLMSISLPPDLHEVPDHLDLFNRSFTIEDSVANLIDYLDSDSEPYSSGKYQGVESSAHEDIFRNEGRIESVSELVRVPGFPPERLQHLAPYLEVEGELTVNINTAGATLIQALHEDLTPETAQAIYQTVRNPDEGPVRNASELVTRVPGFTQDMSRDLASVISTTSLNFLVVAKVSYGSQGSYFAKATLQKSRGNLGDPPTIRHLALF